MNGKAGSADKGNCKSFTRILNGMVTVKDGLPMLRG